MLSQREKKIREAVDFMFQGMDDDVLKTVILYTSLGKSEEEKDKICEAIRQKNEEDLKYYTEKFEIVVDKDNKIGRAHV